MAVDQILRCDLHSSVQADPILGPSPSAKFCAIAHRAGPDPVLRPIAQYQILHLDP
jgi:hypothetical protein